MSTVPERERGKEELWHRVILKNVRSNVIEKPEKLLGKRMGHGWSVWFGYPQLMTENLLAHRQRPHPLQNPMVITYFFYESERPIIFDLVPVKPRDVCCLASF